MSAYYNDSDVKVAAWLAELVRCEHLTRGRVDSRSIARVHPGEVRGATRCHFFAGIGGWDLALQMAGWPANAPVWTGSCPCQPFSTAGRKRGFDDERHLWPAFFALIEKCRPPIVFGEQVASPAGRAWLDAVFADLEGAGYACGAANLCAAGVGAPHIRQRLYWVAVADGERQQGLRLQLRQRQPRQAVPEATGSGKARGLADDASPRRGGPVGAGEQKLPREESGEPRRSRTARGVADGESVGRSQGRRHIAERSRLAAHGEARGMGDAGRPRSRGDAGAVLGEEGESPEQRFGARRVADEFVAAGAVGGAWADAEWWLCQDGKARPAQPGAFPLVDGVPERLVRLRGYGNAIVPEVAATFIRAVMDTLCG